MKKQKSQNNLSLFEPVAEAKPSIVSSMLSEPEKPRIKDACPQCGGRSLKTVRSWEHDDKTHYCCGGCLSEDRTEAFYFTPKVETFDEQAEREEAARAQSEAKKIIARDESSITIVETLTKEEYESRYVAVHESPLIKLAKINDLPREERLKADLVAAVSERDEEPQVAETFVEPQQQALIETGEAWEEHWKGMPEFVQEDLAPWKSIYVHFEDRVAMERFSKLVKQTITLNTRSIWYPEAEIGRIATKRWVGKGGPVDGNTKNDPHRSSS